MTVIREIKSEIGIGEMDEIHTCELPADTIRRLAMEIGELEAENLGLKVALTARRLEMRPGDRIVCKVNHRLSQSEFQELRGRLITWLRPSDDTPLVICDDTADISEQADMRHLAAEILATYTKGEGGYRGRVGQVQIQKWHDQLGGS